MTDGTKRLIETVGCLGKLYDYCNEKIFAGKLKKPVITVQRDERNKTLGWWSKKKVWKENADDEGEHELNMTAQTLSRPPYEIAATMIHEMCHQYASENNMQDTSRGGNYHNKLFKKIAETHGLRVEQLPTIGWSGTSLKDETKELIDGFLAEYPDFRLIYRLPVFKGQTVRSSSTRKYACPVCGMSVRATREVRIMCLDCNVPLQNEN